LVNVEKYREAGLFATLAVTGWRGSYNPNTGHSIAMP
jgi:hypothetical protein